MCIAGHFCKRMATSTTAISAEGRVRSMKDGIHGSFAAQGWNCPNQRKKQTNADRIRSFSDEELAVSRVDRIDFYTKSDIPEYIGDFAGIANSIEEAIALEIKWLQQEVEE